MRLHNFFIEQKIGDLREVTIENLDLIHQWLKVFRMKLGDELILLDNSGYEYVSKIKSLSKKSAEILIAEKRKNNNIPEKEIWLFQSLVKKDNFEWIAEKSTELGVTHIVPVVSERSEKKNINLERVIKIIKEASEQSLRGVLPTLHKEMTLEEALFAVSSHRVTSPVVAVALHTTGERLIRESYMKCPRLAIFIGPEGGWSESDLVKFSASEIKIFSLGKQILRSETASIAILSLMLL